MCRVSFGLSEEQTMFSQDAFIFAVRLLKIRKCDESITQLTKLGMIFKEKISEKEISSASSRRMEL